MAERAPSSSFVAPFASGERAPSSSFVAPFASGERAALLVLAAALAACARTAERPRAYAAAIAVEADPFTPVAGASILREGAVLATTGADGGAPVHLEGTEGDVATLTVRCPPGYESPSPSLRVPLRTPQAPAHVPTFHVTCSPSTFKTVVEVRATNGADLPVLYQGKEVARTSAAGVAYVELHLHPGDRFRLTIGTDEKVGDASLPSDPSATFIAGGRDELLYFDAHVDAQKTPP